MAEEEAVPSGSQCTYRCVVLPDTWSMPQLSAWYPSQCTYRCVVLPDGSGPMPPSSAVSSQCTYRCVVLPDVTTTLFIVPASLVSMHLQVRGAP